ncbi:reverse transcriptase domain-containing protein [Tanacetum coccineum]
MNLSKKHREPFQQDSSSCPHHGFSELHQLDALDSAAGGNFLDKMPRDGLAIIESKSKVRYSRSRAIEPRRLDDDALCRNAKVKQMVKLVAKEQEETRGDCHYDCDMMNGYAIFMNKFPEKLEDPGKFLIPRALQELDRTKTLTLRVGKEELVYYADKSEKNKDKNFVHTISLVIIIEEVHDELALLDLLPPGNDDSTLKKDLHEENFQVYSNPLFEFDDNFKSSNVNPLFEENDKDVEIKSSSSFTILNENNPTSPTLTGEKGHSWKMSMFFSLVRFVWKMMKRNAIRKKIICLLTTYLHQKPKPLSHPQEVEEIKEKEDKVSSDVPINTIVMPIRITFDNPIDFNDHFSKTKDLKDLTVALDSTNSSILPPPLFDSDSPFTAELSASVTLNSLRNEDKVFNPCILVYHAIHDKNLVTLEKNLRENISSGTLLFLKELSIPRPPPEPQDVEKCFEPEAVENGAKGLVTVHSSSTSYSRVKTKGFCQLKGTMDYSSKVQHNGRVKNVISRHLIGHSSNQSHVAMKKAQGIAWLDQRGYLQVVTFVITAVISSLILGLAGYYRRFIENFSKIAKSLTILTQKSKTFDWGEEQELAFQTLKDKLCNAPVLALPDRPEDFVLFSNYDYEIRYHPGKANVVADSLSRKERVKPKGVRAMNMILQSSIKDRILAAQKEAIDEFAGLQKGLDEMIKQRSDGTIVYLDRIWVKVSTKGHLAFAPVIVARHGVPISIISDRDSRFTSRFWHSMQAALGTRLDMSMADHPQTDG